jgi:predicted AAA+ superfamily ATPase
LEKCYNLHSFELPLEGNKATDCFKLFYTDSGLLISRLEKGTSANILSGDLRIYKGAIFENALADALIKNSYPLYYFRKDSGLEVDFIERIGDEATIIECKAQTGAAKASMTIMKNKEKFHVKKLIRIGANNLGKTEETLTLPSYMAFLL